MTTKESEKVTLKALFIAEDPKPLVEGLSFEEGLKLLEELVATVESGTLALETALQGYERGALLIEHLKQHLTKAAARLKTLQVSKD